MRTSNAERRLYAWLKGWNDGATTRKKRRLRLRADADEYERGFSLGESALIDAYRDARVRIRATEA